MTTQGVKRKLTAILSADVKGYSRLMGEDEKGTVRTLNAYKEALTGLIQHHQGRVVDAPGDNVLAEFGSVVDAVECAVEIQKELKTRNAELPESRRMEFRIGVNLGDVIEEESKLFGDGVNIAARLESLADGGGVCISGSAYDFVGKKLPLGYKYLGEHTVKNIEKPVRVYQVLMEPEAVGKVIGEKKAKPRQWQMATIGLVIGVIVVVAAVLIWKLYTPSAPKPEVISKEKITVPQPEKPSATIPTAPTPSTETAPKEKVTRPLHEKVTKPAPPPPPEEEVASKETMALPLPDKPSIAVLPFVNMSGDPQQEYFSDGLTEEIITALSKTPKLFVIARTSSSVYKGKIVNVQQVSRELGVKYVLEGSVRGSGNQLRITAQLIDATTGGHLWAERYDRELKDIFAIQDEITMKIQTSLQVSLTEGEMGRTQAKSTNNLDAYLLFLQALGEARRMNKEGTFLSRQLVEKAIALDPKYAMAYSTLANSYLNEMVLGLSEDPRLSLKKAMELVQKAIDLDNSLALPRSSLGWIYTLMGQHDKGIAECEQAINLEPNSALAYFRLSLALRYAGRPKEAITMCKEAIRLDPIPVSLYYQSLTNAYCLTGQYEEAIAAGKKATSLGPDNLVAHAFLAAAYSLHGREEEARMEAAEVLRINPKFSIDSWTKTMPYKNEADKELTIGALRKAGLK
jgi:adenylate cyclase